MTAPTPSDPGRVRTAAGRIGPRRVPGALPAAVGRRALPADSPYGLGAKEGDIELRVEAFKVFNTPVFSAPASVAGAATFGRITSTLDNTGRQLQFAAKINW